ncbi:hypothetical protein CISIN_1g004657mg [Citrus sinensis]|uniref:SWIRM domain-containing protein n=1 Tax=Citrus sinensis TaxID=2711 RepID=A0A067HBF1_CITSI|nr:hypothetical protein CISIN_1g004657mg [Citrus sinensis]
METPQEPSDNANDDVVSDESSPETDATLSPSQIETQAETDELQNATETNTALEAPVSDSLDDSSDPIPEDQQPQNPNPSEPGPPPRKRRRRKRFFTEINGNPSLARNRRPRFSCLAKEVDTEALIAISVGFPVDSLTEEEIEANVVSKIGGTEQANYIVVRNHILSLWRSNVSVWLTREQALESIRSEHKTLVDSAYDFLLEHGYINFGLAPPIKEVKLGSFGRVERGNVVIVGAGLAGLVAARQLISMGFKVVVLEGRERPGGRVKTRKMKCDGVVAAADVGGSVLTGINGNPLGVLARQLELPLHKVRDICPLYLPNGKAIDADIDSGVEVSFNKLLDRVCKLRHDMIEEFKSVDVPLGVALEAFRNVYKVAEDLQERMLLNWHLANLEYANASLMSNLSMAYWDQDDPYEMGGDHCFIPGGNEWFVRALAEDLPIFYQRTVQSIRYGVDGVMVYAGGQEFRGDMVLCTVPLGVLKKGTIEFVPELPQRKKDAIQRLGYGLLNKVAMLFPHNFWGGEIDTFGHLTEDSSMRDPVQAICTRWGKDRFSYGSYSYVAVGSSGDDYDILAETVGDGRVFFAGEATNKQYPATMHGAFLSGMREAASILRVAKRRSLALTNKAYNESEDNGNLDKLFETPDLTFGSFSALFDPKSIDLESDALLRVKFQGENFDSGHLCLYGLVTRKQAVQLRELDGDGNRMKMLHDNFRVKLVARRGVCNATESLITRIKATRFSLNDGV